MRIQSFTQKWNHDVKHKLHSIAGLKINLALGSVGPGKNAKYNYLSTPCNHTGVLYSFIKLCLHLNT